MKKIVNLVLLGLFFLPAMLLADTHVARRTHASSHVKESARTQKKLSTLQHSRRPVRTGTTARLRRASLTIRRSHRSYERFTGNSFTENNGEGDITTGEDPIVRKAALDALGNMNGTVVAIDPSNARVLAMVNQKLALSSGAEPCSTIKLSVALAALEEGIITKDTPVNLGGNYHMNLTEALAHSNNLYFETLGRRLGFERVRHYANEFGLGELAGYHIEGEQLGIYPDQELPEKLGGVGRMCSFGEGVSMTPLQLGALVAAIANGGTLYYLQHPNTPEEALNLEPRVKRTLDIGKLVPEISEGMAAAVRYGTARSLRASFNQFPVLGKTGTCSNNGTRYGWFASYADTQFGKIVTVFFLEGGRPTFGPKAAELTGYFYRNLWDASYFAQKSNTQLDKTSATAAGVTQ
jgi:penicillin-binding protein 2